MGCRWMEHVSSRDIVEHVWFVDSLWFSYMSTTINQVAMDNFFGKVDLATQIFTFFPIIDRYKMSFCYIELVILMKI